MVGTKKAKETEKKMMMKIKKAATSKSHGSRPTVRKYCWPSAALRLLTRSHSGPHFTALVAAIPGGACHSAVWRRVVEDHDRRPDF
jgi:hypothetical protein